MTWVNLSSAFGYGTKLTSTQIQNLRDNIAAMCAGDSGAPEVTKDALKTVANTTGVSGGIAAGAVVNIMMQDYCFSPNLYSSNGRYLQTSGFSDSQADTTGRLSFGNDHPTEAYNYAARWRYMTSSDEPFVYVIRDKATGEIHHLWACDDPPPGYWGLSAKPQDFISPIQLENYDSEDDHDQIIAASFEEITLFKYAGGKEGISEIGNKGSADKKLPFQTMNDDYDYDSDKKLFVRKNIGQL